MRKLGDLGIHGVTVPGILSVILEVECNHMQHISPFFTQNLIPKNITHTSSFIRLIS